MFASPVGLVVDYDFPVGRLILSPGEDRHGQPLGPLGGFDPVAISPGVLVVLDIIVDDKDVASVHLGEISKPGQ